MLIASLASIAGACGSDEPCQHHACTVLDQPAASDRIPQGQQKTTFWQGALTYAGSKNDADLFEKIMNRAKKELAGDFRVKRYLERVEAQLERMRRAKR